MNTREYGLPHRRNRAYMLFSRLGASTVPASHWYVPDAIAIRTSQNLERFKCTAKPLAYFLTDLEAGAKYFKNKPVHKTTAAKMTKWLETANLLEADVVALETSPSFLPAIRSHRVRWLIAFHMLRLKKSRYWCDISACCVASGSTCRQSSLRRRRPASSSLRYYERNLFCDKLEQILKWRGVVAGSGVVIARPSEARAPGT